MNCKERRGPGRPPRVVLPTAPVHGIVNKPFDGENIIELSYFDPIVFKYLFILLKNLKVRDIYFKFLKESVQIYTKDNINNRIFITIDGNKMLNYYCKYEKCICINRDNIQPVFIYLNRTIDKIKISLEEGNDMINIELYDNTLHKIKKRGIITSESLPEELLQNVERELRESSCPISFSLTTRDFKDTVADAGNYGDKITIEKHGLGPLLLKFIKAHTNICSEEYTSSSKIDLISDLDETESYRCTLHTHLLKELSVSIVNNKVNIKCLKNNKAIISSSISDIIDFSIFADNIVNY